VLDLRGESQTIKRPLQGFEVEVSDKLPSFYNRTPVETMATNTQKKHCMEILE